MYVKPYTFREFNKLLKNNGYYRLRQSGDHVIYSNGTVHISVPRHKEPKKYLTNDLIKKYKLKVN